MKRILLNMLILFVGVMLGVGAWAEEAVKNAEKDQEMTFKDYTDHLDLSKNTALHVTNFWTKTKNKTYTWAGKVVDVKGGRGKAEIHVANGEVPTANGINLVLVTYQMDNAAALKVGQEIKFKGQVYNYKGRRGSPTVVYLNNVEILPLNK